MKSYKVLVRYGDRFYTEESNVNLLYAECVKAYYTDRGYEAIIVEG